MSGWSIPILWNSPGNDMIVQARMPIVIQALEVMGRNCPTGGRCIVGDALTCRLPSLLPTRVRFRLDAGGQAGEPKFPAFTGMGQPDVVVQWIRCNASRRPRAPIPHCPRNGWQTPSASAVCYVRVIACGKCGSPSDGPNRSQLLHSRMRFPLGGPSAQFPIESKTHARRKPFSHARWGRGGGGGGACPHRPALPKQEPHYCNRQDDPGAAPTGLRICSTAGSDGAMDRELDTSAPFGLASSSLARDRTDYRFRSAIYQADLASNVELFVFSRFDSAVAWKVIKPAARCPLTAIPILLRRSCSPCASKTTKRPFSIACQGPTLADRRCQHQGDSEGVAPLGLRAEGPRFITRSRLMAKTVHPLTAEPSRAPAKVALWTRPTA